MVTTLLARYRLPELHSISSSTVNLLGMMCMREVLKDITALISRTLRRVVRPQLVAYFVLETFLFDHLDTLNRVTQTARY